MRTGALFIGGLLASTALAAPALAQSASYLPPRFVLDGNAVNPATGKLIVSDESVSIGAPGSGMSFQRMTAGGFFDHHRYIYAIYGSLNAVQVEAGDLTFGFNLVGGNYVNQQGTGETLTRAGSNWT